MQIAHHSPSLAPLFLPPMLWAFSAGSPMQWVGVGHNPWNQIRAHEEHLVPATLLGTVSYWSFCWEGGGRSVSRKGGGCPTFVGAFAAGSERKWQRQAREDGGWVFLFHLPLTLTVWAAPSVTLPRSWLYKQGQGGVSVEREGRVNCCYHLLWHQEIRLLIRDMQHKRN